eukprot:1957197-Amphidinium_carterae.1
MGPLGARARTELAEVKPFSASWESPEQLSSGACRTELRAMPFTPYTLPLTSLHRQSSDRPSAEA